jgi:hypothetical protein
MAVLEMRSAKSAQKQIDHIKNDLMDAEARLTRHETLVGEYLDIITSADPEFDREAFVNYAMSELI